MVLDKRTLYKVIGIIIVIIIAAVFVAVKVYDFHLSSGEKNGQTKKITEFNLAMNPVKTLNPVASTDEDTYYISKLVYDSLFVMDNDMTPQASLVKNFSYSEDGKELTLNLKSGVKWHNGNSLTAADVAFSIKAYIAKGKKGVYYNNVSNISKITTSGDNTCIIKYKSPDDVSYAKLTFPIIPEDEFSSVSDAGHSDADFIPVGSGPYKFESYGPTIGLKLVANDDYWGNKAKNSINFKILRTESQELNLIGANEVSFTVQTAIDRQKTMGSMDLKNVDFISNEVEYIGFNCGNVDIVDVNVRKAVAYSISLNDILQEGYYGSGVISDSLYYPGYLGVENQGDQYKKNRRKAEELLKKAGFKDSNKDGYLENKAGNELNVVILVNSDNSARCRAADIIAEALDDEDIKCTVDSCPWDEYVSKLKKGSYHIFIGGSRVSDYFDLNPILGDTDTNFSYSGNKKLFKMTSGMNSSLTSKERKSLYEEMKTEMTNDLPYYCMLYKTYSAVVSKELRGNIEPLFNNYYSSCEDWYSLYKIKNIKEVKK